MSRPRPLRDLGVILVIIVATVAAFARVYAFDFTSWDDHETVARNPLLNPPSIRSLGAFWTRPLGHLYIPVTYTVWSAIAIAPGTTEPATPTSLPRLRPQPFHLVNLMLHVAAAVLLFGVLDLLVSNWRAAALGALLFALHPVQVEAVAWVSGMKDVLCGAMSLLAIYEYLQFTQQAPGSKRARIHYVVATIAFVCAMLAKPTAMVVPLLLIVLDTLVLGRPMKTALKSIGPWLFLAIPCVVATKMIQPAPHAHEAAAPFWARPFIAADALAFYLYKLFYPAKFGFDYGRTPDYVRSSGVIAWTWLIPAAVAAIAWLTWRRNRPWGRIIVAALAIFIIVLLPVLGLVPFDFQTYSTVADHYLYLAMLGPAMLLAWIVSRRPTTPVIVIVACVIAVLGVRTFTQTAHWRDTPALFTHGLDVNPRSFAAYNSLAALAIEKDDPARAIPLIQRALDIRKYAASYHTYGEALRRLGRPNEAIAAFRAALEREPDYVPSLANLAAMLAEQGRLDEAIPLARRAVDADPHSVPNRMNLALMYLNSNRADLAAPQLDAVLRLDPSNATARDLQRELKR